MRDLPDSPIIERDGTSQTGRVLPALDPSYVAVDERSAHDLLGIAREYAKELRYYNAENQPDGDWSGFLDTEDLRGLAAVVESSAPAQGTGRVDRPHLALLLAFLHLLRYPQGLINELTRRHLTFYYSQLLHMTRKSAVADRVHVVVKLAAGVDRVRLLQGTALRAGKDGQGKEQVYRLDREVVLGRARIARLSSAYARREVVGLRDARERTTGTRQEAFLAMLRIALGHPRPGDALPRYGGGAVTYPLTYPLLIELQQRVAFAASDLFLDLSDLHRLMRYERQRAADAGEWSAINAILQQAGRNRLADPGWQLNPADPRDFTANLAKAIGGAPDFQRDGLPEVDSVEDLYEQRIRQDVRDYIVQKLHFAEADFYTMMRMKIRIDNEWGEINRILEQAGRRKRSNPAYKLHPALPGAFAANLQAAIGPVAFAGLPHAILPAVAGIDAYYDAILEIEAYFHMTAAQFGYVMATAEVVVPPGATPREWDNVDRILSGAHRDKVFADRRQALRDAREREPDPARGFRAMLRIALGRGPNDATEPSLADLQDDVRPATDYAFLSSILARLVTGTGGSVTAEEWARVYQVVELAQRVRERLPDPVAQRTTWLDLHAAEDTTSVVAGSPDAAQPRWKTFGQTAPVTRLDPPPPNLIGWAISSALLVLGQGKRTIVLTLGFPPDPFAARAIEDLFAQGTSEPPPLELQVSTEAGWLTLTASASVGDYRTLSQVARTLASPLRAIQFTAVLGEDAVATAGNPGTAWATWPVLRVMLRRVWDSRRGQYVARYEPFRALPLAAVHLRVAVEGRTPQSIQNDDAVLSAGRPFEPFGARPAVGSRFYLADPELVIKRLDRVNFHIEWMGGPDDLAKHYASYPHAGPFTAQISLVDHRVRRPLAGAPSSLFAGVDTTKPQDLTFPDLATIVERDGYRYEASSAPAAEPRTTAWPRYFEWELTPRDFEHPVYPAVAAQKALEFTAALLRSSDTPKAADYQVKPPYTPRIKRLRVDYAAQTEISLDREQTATASDRLFHIHPFGASPIAAEAVAGVTPFLPCYDHEGELYLGLEGVRPPETLSLLFQLAEGSADPDVAPAAIEWCYLTGDRWRTLHDGQVLLDTTNGLLDSGIVQIALPPAEPSTRLPRDLYWIRARVADHADSVCDTVAIHSQAASATFEDHGNAAEHFARALPARSITSLVQRVPQIAAIEQPYPSRGGRPVEAEAGFFTRISERLRHKQRALTPWDYERLVLERFPELYKVKCLPANIAEDPDSLGTVEIIVIPQIRGSGIANPFEPKVSAALLAEIAAYLADKCPPTAAVRVRNAHFVQVKVRVGVRFQGSGDAGFYKRLLKDDLNRFLSPWAYAEGADVVIGGKIFANSIVNFIDGRDYVDYVANIELFSIDDGKITQAAAQPEQGMFVAAARPDAVLVAAPDHEIDLISDAGYTAASFTGINYMKIELDFVVAGSA